MGFVFQVTSPTGQRYIGKTSREMEVRWDEMAYEELTPSSSKFAREIVANRGRGFKVAILEEVPIQNLDEVYLKKVHEMQPDYPSLYFTPVMKSNVLYVQEANIYFPAANFVEEIRTITSWSKASIEYMLETALKGGLFLHYHMFYVKEGYSEKTARENWIKQIASQYEGTHYFCIENNTNYATKTEAAYDLVKQYQIYNSSKIPQDAWLKVAASGVQLSCDKGKPVAEKYNFYCLPGYWGLDFTVESPELCRTLPLREMAQIVKKEVCPYLSTKAVTEKVYDAVMGYLPIKEYHFYRKES